MSALFPVLTGDNFSAFRIYPERNILFLQSNKKDERIWKNYQLAHVLNIHVMEKV